MTRYQRHHRSMCTNGSVTQVLDLALAEVLRVRVVDIA